VGTFPSRGGDMHALAMRRWLPMAFTGKPSTFPYLELVFVALLQPSQRKGNLPTLVKQITLAKHSSMA